MVSRARPAIILSMLAAAALAPEVASAQSAPTRSSSVEVFVTIGVARLWRYEDRSFGKGLNVGVGVAARRQNGVGVSLQIDRAFGWSRSRTPHGAPTVASANFQYFFGDRRVQPYLTAGMSALWSDDVGFGPNLGAGFRADAGDHWSLGPDIQWAEGTWLSRSNLSVTRFGVATGFRPIVRRP
jgi:hypothetical protein